MQSVDTIRKALRIAIQQDDVDAVRREAQSLASLPMGLEYGLGEYLGGTPLYATAVESDVSIVRCLLDLGADIEGYGSGFSTPLHGAVVMLRPEVVDVLLVAGASPNALSGERRERTALHMALNSSYVTDTQRQLAITLRLLEAGADPLLTPAGASDEYLTPFQEAIYCGNREGVSLILGRLELDPNETTLDGRTLFEIRGQPHREEFNMWLRSSLTEHAVSKATRTADKDRTNANGNESPPVTHSRNGTAPL
jgi:ankyrin repeat protein